MRNIKTFEDVRLALVDIQTVIDNLKTRSQDLHGLRMTNAGDAINPQDYITKAQLDATIEGVVPATLPRIISVITNCISAAALSGNWIYYQVDLVGPTTLPDSPDAMPGTFIAIVIFQDAVGGRALTWPAKYVGTANFDINKDPFSYTAALFYCVDPASVFWLLAPPITGVI